VGRVRVSRRWIEFGLLALVGLFSLGVALAGASVIAGARPAQLTTVDGTTESYDHLSDPLFLGDVVPALGDYELTLRTGPSQLSHRAFVLHGYDFDSLPDLATMPGKAATLTVGSDTAWSDAARAYLPVVLGLKVNGVDYASPYAIHPRLRFWDSVATGLFWIVPLIVFAGLVGLAFLPIRRRLARRPQLDVEDRWSSYALVTYAVWLLVGLLGGYLLRVRSASVEFWLLIATYALVPGLLATILARVENRFGVLLPKPGIDVYRIGVATIVTAIVEIGAVMAVREALVTRLA
jgi:hypothetical protein